VIHRFALALRARNDESRMKKGRGASPYLSPIRQEPAADGQTGKLPEASTTFKFFFHIFSKISSAGLSPRK
jgi:hypothetical protein